MDGISPERSLLEWTSSANSTLTRLLTAGNRSHCPVSVRETKAVAGGLQHIHSRKIAAPLITVKKTVAPAIGSPMRQELVQPMVRQDFDPQADLPLPETAIKLDAACGGCKNSTVVSATAD